MEMISGAVGTVETGLGRFKDWVMTNRKRKILFMVFFIIVVLLIAQLVFHVPVSTAVNEPVALTPIGFNVHLTVDGDGNEVWPATTKVVFPAGILFCSVTSHPYDVLESIMDDNMVSVYTEENGAWVSWVKTSSGQYYNRGLNEIKSYQDYYIMVGRECDLSLNCWD